LWVAVILNSQPFFIAGVENPEEARDNAFGAFIMFISTFALSAVGMWYDTNIKQDQMDSEGNEETDYQLAGDFPNYGGTSS
jgi:hypothetical protein